MERIKAYIGARGYCPTPGLLENFVLSLQCRPFVILTGYSGTDKTLLPRLTAEAMGATAENGRYLGLRVSPDWMDSSDLFGWLNLEGKFIPGVITEFLARAHKDPDHPYFLCLDSLILSRAEYFLRDYVAAVESLGQENEQPFVNLLYYGRDEAAAEKYGVIPALRNVFTVATVDLDLEGRPLSRKLLDRVHTMTILPDSITGTDTEAPAPAAEMGLLQNRYHALDQCPEDALEAGIALFEAVNRILTPANTYIGYKLRNDGILYLAHAKGYLPQTEAEDHVVCQKILTRLQCTTKTVPVLEKLGAFCRERGYGAACQALETMVDKCRQTGVAAYWD